MPRGGSYGASGKWPATMMKLVGMKLVGMKFDGMKLDGMMKLDGA
jgi:hypothetical protein